MKYLFLFLFFLSSLLIGAYATSQFRFNKPVEPHRWALTSFFGCFFLVSFLKENKKNA